MKYITWCDETGDYMFTDTYMEATKEAKNLIHDAMQNDSFDSAECTIYRAINLVNGTMSVDIHLDVYPEEEEKDADIEDKEEKSVGKVATVILPDTA
jgi:hypothetical protein